MNILKKLKLQLRPPEMKDPDFGDLIFMYIPNNPKRSYWEAEWLFPPTNSLISIGLDGDEMGPSFEARVWHLELPNRFSMIIQLVKPELAKVLKSMIGMDLPKDIFSVVKLAGFGLETGTNPLSWDIAFETIGKKWLGITIPFIGNTPKQAVIDT